MEYFVVGFVSFCFAYVCGGVVSVFFCFFFFKGWKITLEELTEEYIQAATSNLPS